jgi:hypothetical protein
MVLSAVAVQPEKQMIDSVVDVITRWNELPIVLAIPLCAHLSAIS